MTPADWPPSIAGLTWRRFGGADDYAALADVINASEAADHIEETRTAAELAQEFVHRPGFDPLADVLLAADEAGRLVAAAYVWVRLSSAGEQLYRQRGYVRPEWRRRGLGLALWRWAEARLRAIARATPAVGGVQRFYEMVAEDTARGRTALAQAHGYRPVRYFFFMQRPTLDGLPTAPLPDGLAFRPAQREQTRAIWDAKEAAFAEHWGHTVKTDHDYQVWAADPHQALGLWVVAADQTAGQIAGVALNDINHGDNERYGFKRGWVNSLGVVPAWRGRGLGRALLVESLRRLRAAGMTEAVLGVDAGNATGALRLYESVGFHVLNQDAVYRKLLED